MMSALSDSSIKALLRWSLANAPSRGPHITRFFMYRALLGYLRSEDAAGKKGLSISLSKPFAQDILGLRLTEFTEANFPEYNLLDLPFDNEKFDFCVSDQVLEHVEGDPVQAFSESARVVRPGGFICHTTCFMNEIHGVPSDFWRFTPDSLSLMSKISGCKPVTVAGWGNREAWAIIQHGFRFEGVPMDESHPVYQIAVKNEKDVPIVVWVVARKLPLPGR